MTQETPRKKFHLLKRLSRAAKWSADLEKLCLECADTRTQLEAEAYSAWMHGNVLLEKDCHKEALAKFTHSKLVYEKLGQIGGFTLRSLCEEKIMALEPSLRYCNYVLQRQMGKKGGVDKLLKEMGSMNDLLKSKLDQALEESRAEQAKDLESILWQSQQIPLKNEKVGVLLVTADDLSSELSAAVKAAQANAMVEEDDSEEGDGDKVGEILQQLFSAYDDALEHIRKDISDAEKLRAKGTTGNLGVSEDAVIHLKMLKSYVSFQKLNITKARNFHLAQRLGLAMREQQRTKSGSDGKAPRQKVIKPDDLVHLYEKIADNIQEMKDLDSKRESKCDYEGEESAAKAFRCFFLAEAYLFYDKLPQAGALFKQAVFRVQEALRSQKDSSSELSERLTSLEQEALGRTSGVQAQIFIDAEHTTEKLKNVSLEQVIAADGRE